MLAEIRKEAGNFFGVECKDGRQLNEDGTAMFPIGIEYIEEPGAGLLRIVQLFRVRDETAYLGAKAERFWNGIYPVPDSRCQRKLIEAAVDLRGIEHLAVIFQLLRNREPGRVKNPAPVLIAPAGSADIKFTRSHTLPAVIIVPAIHWAGIDICNPFPKQYHMIQRDGALSSLWQDTTAKTKDSYISNRILPADQPFDVIIVGGGITGVSSALLLQEAGFRCTLLEANTLCFGTTGGTTAHLNTLLDTPYTTIIRNFGKENASLVAQATRQAIDVVRSNCAKYSIDAGFEEQTAYVFSQDDDQSQLLHDMLDATQLVGVAAEYTDSIPVPIPTMKAMAVPGQAKFHPTRYVLGMARAFQEMGGRIIELCRVTKAEDTIDGVLVHTDHGDLKSKYLIYATHIPPGINVLDTRCAPYRSYAISVKLEGEYPDGLIYDLYEPYHYYRTQVIDGQPYLIAGGEDHKTGHEENTEACFLRLEAHVRKYFPVKEVTHKWSSQYYEPTDGLPYIGHLPGESGNILVATGFSGNGMTYGTVAALLFRDLLLNSSDKYVKLFDPNRLKPIAGFSHFVKENADVAKKWLGRLFPSEKLGEFAELAPGEARVVKVEGETVAIYKNEAGELRALSPTCTHMGCHVAWNDAEKSWDCPCHGARYAIDGTVLTGPADRDLERIDLAELVEK